MDAGVVEFKLCDRAFECESCKFDALIRRKPESDQRSDAALPSGSTSGLHAGREALSAEQLFIDILRKRLRPLQERNLLQDRLYHQSRYWMRRESDDVYQFGIDHIAADLIHPALGVVFPGTSGAVHRHDPLCWIIVMGGTLPLRSPVNGVVLRYNEELKHNPLLLNSDPYEDGMILKIRLEGNKRGFYNFRQSDEAQRQIEGQLAEIERSFLQAFHQGKPPVGTTLFDGGVRLENIEGILGAQTFFDTVSGIMNSAL